jgi:hypothetical protein
MDLLDHLGSIASLVSLPAAAITVWAFLRSPGAARTIVLWIVLPIAIGAYTLDVGDRLGWIELSEKGDLIQSWGHTGNALYMTVNSRKLWDYKEKFKMMLVIEIPYSNVDRITDTAIDKSTAFTITGDAVNVAALLTSPTHLRPPNNNPSQISVMVEFNLVLIPNDLRPEQITSLADVQRLGGKIVATRSRDVSVILEPLPGG